MVGKSPFPQKISSRSWILPPLEFTGHRNGWDTPKSLGDNLCLEEKTHFPEFLIRDSWRENIPHLTLDNSLSMVKVPALPPGCNSKRIRVWDHGFLHCQNSFTTKYWILSSKYWISSPKYWILSWTKGSWSRLKCWKANVWNCRVLKGEGLIFRIDPNQQHFHCSKFSWKSCSKSHGHPLDLSPWDPMREFLQHLFPTSLWLWDIKGFDLGCFYFFCLGWNGRKVEQDRFLGSSQPKPLWNSRTAHSKSFLREAAERISCSHPKTWAQLPSPNHPDPAGLRNTKWAHGRGDLGRIGNSKSSASPGIKGADN